ncbi:uncharacterized protein LOC21398924 [Morus notabilis]|uniref:uncharacterized protein LOC21398924 n=1 Tax=Morus notabilis TaxID=981085 RepID=UPI000CED67A2|nr:uncharacterized protein LOC21398924 [Morus notabilis]
MCGRARCTLRADDVPRACHRNNGSVRTVNMDRYRPSYNVSPGSNIPVVRREDGSDGEGFVVHCMKWGLIPSFTKKTDKPDHYKMFNARSESIGEKVSFRRLIPKSRCLVAVEGFYEWKKDGSKKQPYYIHFKDGRPLVFAALYDSWENYLVTAIVIPAGEILYTFTILTISSSSALGWLHDRMPVIFGDKESSDAWLTGSSSKVGALLKPYEDPDLVWYPVTPAMGKPSFDGPECIEMKLKADGNIPISKFFSAKGTKKEADLNPEESSSKVDSAKCLEEKPESKANRGPFSSTEKGEADSKSSVSSFSQGGAEKCQIKRDHEKLSADSKSNTDETKKLFDSPGRKKVKLKSAGDYKQPTVLAYFGKK